MPHSAEHLPAPRLHYAPRIRGRRTPTRPAEHAMQVRCGRDPPAVRLLRPEAAGCVPVLRAGCAHSCAHKADHGARRTAARRLPRAPGPRALTLTRSPSPLPTAPRQLLRGVMYFLQLELVSAVPYRGRDADAQLVVVFRSLAEGEVSHELHRLNFTGLSLQHSPFVEGGDRGGDSEDDEESEDWRGPEAPRGTPDELAGLGLGGDEEGGSGKRGRRDGTADASSGRPAHPSPSQRRKSASELDEL